jgi:hypothetical protein
MTANDTASFKARTTFDPAAECVQFGCAQNTIQNAYSKVTSLPHPLKSAQPIATRFKDGKGNDKGHSPPEPIAAISSSRLAGCSAISVISSAPLSRGSAWRRLLLASVTQEVEARLISLA